ncbi:putative Late nodulin [Medicago truncatula]|uniref:Nodule Cysteine-Rich (NCR) secreted peptide n=1 Tax=Medicago truncatula TaxID=3880 RepID=A7KH86_MEDTR|nr:nodule-specific cysteine-rich peptide 94 [Medicago truncatula]AES97511.1 Nodule Cysteine-Rich (NCR) secreted peptide [Medicago truncatula]RHN55866.1 putative Late nodulin [Medicago truncatula]
MSNTLMFVITFIVLVTLFLGPKNVYAFQPCVTTADCMKTLKTDENIWYECINDFCIPFPIPKGRK